MNKKNTVLCLNRKYIIYINKKDLFIAMFNISNKICKNEIHFIARFVDVSSVESEWKSEHKMFIDRKKIKMSMLGNREYKLCCCKISFYG